MFFRSFTSASMENDVSEEESPNSGENDDLKSRVFRIRLPKRSAMNVLRNWVAEGNEVAVSELRDIAKELKKSHRYKHALEVNWIPPFFRSLWFFFVFVFVCLCLVAKKMLMNVRKICSSIVV